jgi:hypothetical protein
MAQPKLVPLPTLQRHSSVGGVVVYESAVQGDTVLRWMWTKSAAHVGGEVHKRAMAPLRCTSKFVGNANERTPHDTALIKARSEWKKKVDRGYAEEELEPRLIAKAELDALTKVQVNGKTKKIPSRALDELATPQLLQKLADVGLPERACVSEKRNGICALYLAVSKQLVSRKGLPLKMPAHLLPHLERVCELAEDWMEQHSYLPRGDDEVVVKGVHGELDLPDELGLSFQQKMEVLNAKKTPHRLNDRVVLCVFDLADQSVAPFVARHAAMVYAHESWKAELEASGRAEEAGSLVLVRCVTIDTDASMVRSLETRPAGREALRFVEWVRSRYDGHAERWEYIPPLPVEAVKDWLDGRRELTRLERTRLLHRWFVEDLKEEGSVVRDMTGYYWGNDYRTASVLKLKDYEDEEAVVVGYECATGEQEGAIVMVLRSLEHKVVYTCVFSQEMGLGVEERRALYTRYQTGELKPGHVYTVRFQERHESGIPQFPTIVGDADMSKGVSGRSLTDLAVEGLQEYLTHVEETSKKKAARKRAN